MSVFEIPDCSLRMSVSLPPQRTPFGDLDRRSLLAYASSVWPLQNSVMRPWARRRVTGRDNYSPLVHRIATSIATHHPTGFGSFEGTVPRAFRFCFATFNADFRGVLIDDSFVEIYEY